MALATLASLIPTVSATDMTTVSIWCDKVSSGGRWISFGMCSCCCTGSDSSGASSPSPHVRSCKREASSPHRRNRFPDCQNDQIIHLYFLPRAQVQYGAGLIRSGDFPSQLFTQTRDPGDQPFVGRQFPLPVVDVILQTDSHISPHQHGVKAHS